MKFFRLSVILMWCFALFSGALLFVVSQDVQQAEREVVRLERMLEDKRENSNILKAEWDYLNRPDRLESLASILDETQKAQALPIMLSPNNAVFPKSDMTSPQLAVDQPAVIPPSKKPVFNTAVKIQVSQDITPPPSLDTLPTDTLSPTKIDEDDFSTLLNTIEGGSAF